MKTLHPELHRLLEEMRTATNGKGFTDVTTFPLGHPTEDGWVIYTKNIPVEAIMQAARDLAEKSPSWRKATLFHPGGPIPAMKKVDIKA